MPTLRIGRVASRYVLPHGPEPTAALHARLDRVATGHLGQALDEVLPLLPEAAGDDVWLVRNLDVDVAIGLDAADDPGRLARAWSRQVVATLREALAGGRAEIVRFESEAAWTARFVAEVAAGTAWDRWYLRAFSSLRPLPAGMAIAEAIMRTQGGAAAVLAELWRQGELERVLLACGEADARRILGVLALPGPPGAVAGRALARRLAGLRGALRPASDPHPAGSALRLLAAAAASGVALVPGAAATARAVVVLADLLAGAADGSELAGAVGGKRWAEALRLAGRRPQEVTADELAALEVLADLTGTDGQWLARLAEDLASGTGQRRAGEDPPVVATPFGGLLLVWPLFAESWPLPPADGDVETAGLHRLLVAAHLFGRSSVAALLRDPVLALLCGLDRPPAPGLLEEARASLPVTALHAAAVEGPEPEGAFFGEPRDPAEAAAARFCALVLHRFAGRLPGFAGSTPGYLLRNFLAVPATLRLGEDIWEASITPPPLEVVLRMSGLSSLRFPLPWSPAARLAVDLG